jgi:hypothetical protein
MGPPPELVLGLRSRFAIESFVETGTFEGRTAAWASRHFSRVFTIEASPERHRQSRSALAAHANVEALLGDSRVLLPELGPRLQGNVLFWLDAHWCGGDTFGSDDECPLLAEIASVADTMQHRPDGAFVLIDDARLFLAPPPRPHAPDQWPDLRAVLDACSRLAADPYVVIVDDVIVCVPRCARDYVQSYGQDSSTAAEQERARAGQRSLGGRVLDRGLRLGRRAVAKLTAPSTRAAATGKHPRRDS